ncbi:MAG: tetratricopeptide repeat protein [Deltaproteobacteria bacterium]|nr:tetratricopeptide repeat protein [Deltaproteobacteria bacterium]
MVVVALLALAAPLGSDGREEFSRGAQLYAEDRPSEALEFFRTAYERSKHRPSSVLALAQCERRLGKFTDALEHFREYLRLAPAPQERERVRLIIEQVENFVLPLVDTRDRVGTLEASLERVAAKSASTSLDLAARIEHIEGQLVFASEAQAKRTDELTSRLDRSSWYERPLPVMLAGAAIGALVGGLVVGFLK